MERPPPKCFAFLAALWTFLMIAHASAESDLPWLEYAPPPECPGEQAIGDRVEEWLGRSGVPDGLSVGARLDWLGDVWEVRVAVQQGSEVGERQVRVPSCSDAADFIALAVVLAVDPSLVPQTDTTREAGLTDSDVPIPASSEPNSETVNEPLQETELSEKSEPPPTNGTVEESGATLESPPEQARSGPVVVSRAAGLMQAGHFEGGQAGMGLGIGVAWWRVHFDAMGSLFPARRYRFEGAENELKYSQWSLGVRGCAVLGTTSWAVLPCLHAEYQRLRLAEVGLRGAKEKPNFLAGMGLFGRIKLTGLIHPYGGARFAVPFDRTVFRLETGRTLHQFRYSIQGEVGLQFFWRRE